MNGKSLIALCAGAFLFSFCSVTLNAQTATEADIKKYISQINNDDIKIRQNASEQLIKIGAPALPLLKEAAASNDPETRARAQSAIYNIQNNLPAAQPPQQQPAQQPQQQQPQQQQQAQPQQPAVKPNVTYKTVNDTKIVDAVEGPRKTHIESSSHGIVMKVTEPKDGEDVTTEYQAKNSQDLQQKNPDAFAIYDKYMKMLPKEKPRRMGMMEALEQELMLMGGDDEIEDAQEAAEVRQILRMGIFGGNTARELRAALARWDEKQGAMKQAALDEKSLQEDIKNLLRSLQQLDPQIDEETRK